MKAIVDVDLCAGCGACTEVCSEVFEIQDGIAVNLIGEDKDIPEELQERCREAAEACPVEAIVIEE